MTYETKDFVPVENLPPTIFLPKLLSFVTVPHQITRMGLIPSFVLNQVSYTQKLYVFYFWLQGAASFTGDTTECIVSQRNHLCFLFLKNKDLGGSSHRDFELIRSNNHTRTCLSLVVNTHEECVPGNEVDVTGTSSLSIGPRPYLSSSFPPLTLWFRD